MATHMILMLSSMDSPETQGVVERIKDAYPGYYPLADERAFMVRSPDVAEVICQKIGLLDQAKHAPAEQATGVVAKINGAFSGFASQGLWEWMREGA